jgi:hypothetical protein
MLTNPSKIAPSAISANVEIDKFLKLYCWKAGQPRHKMVPVEDCEHRYCCNERDLDAAGSRRKAVR